MAKRVYIANIDCSGEAHNFLGKSFDTDGICTLRTVYNVQKYIVNVENEITEKYTIVDNVFSVRDHFQYFYYTNGSTDISQYDFMKNICHNRLTSKFILYSKQHIVESISIVEKTVSYNCSVNDRYVSKVNKGYRIDVLYEVVYPSYHYTAGDYVAVEDILQENCGRMFIIATQTLGCTGVDGFYDSPKVVKQHMMNVVVSPFSIYCIVEKCNSSYLTSIIHISELYICKVMCLSVIEYLFFAVGDTDMIAHHVSGLVEKIDDKIMSIYNCTSSSTQIKDLIADISFSLGYATNKYTGFRIDNKIRLEGVKKYKDGLYIGMFNNGIREGCGIMLYNNNDIYEGQWRDDKKIK